MFISNIWIRNSRQEMREFVEYFKLVTQTNTCHSYTNQF